MQMFDIVDAARLESQKSSLPESETHVRELKPIISEFSIAKLECKPGDTVIFKFPGLTQIAHSDPEMVNQMVDFAHKFVPEGVKVMVTDVTTEIAVVRGENWRQWLNENPIMPDSRYAVGGIVKA